MQSMDWPPEHCDALREFLTGGMSYAGTAKAINARFDTDYSRSATLGRARRMGLAGPTKPQVLLRRRPQAHPLRLPEMRRHRRPKPRPSMPVFEPARVKLRCVAIEPRHLSFLELDRGDCRYPYGGDAENEAITFCGHPRRPGSSYCTPHFRLTREPHASAKRLAPPHFGWWRRHEKRNETRTRAGRSSSRF